MTDETKALAMPNPEPDRNARPVADWTTPTNLQGAQKLAQILAGTALIPEAYQRKPDDILVAMMMGSTLGLAPTQALQSIAVIRGTPSVWGDAMPALCMAHPLWKDIDEPFDEEKMEASCKVWRKGHAKPCVRTYSKDDAIAAGLWGKNVWKSYPKRMLQLRARSWALRDTFPDALKWLKMAEEVMDYAKPVQTREINSERGLEFLHKQAKHTEKASDDLPVDEKGTEAVPSNGIQIEIGDIDDGDVPIETDEDDLRQAFELTMGQLSDLFTRDPEGEQGYSDAVAGLEKKFGKPPEVFDLEDLKKVRKMIKAKIKKAKEQSAG